MFIEERHQAILQLLNEKGRITAAQIQALFHVSFDTARRDLRIMEENGLLKRTHGGALPLRQVGFSKPPKATARDITEIKENYFAIALEALSMIRENDVIFITSATVGLFMAQNLPKDIRLTVVVNSIIIAEALRDYDNLRVILTAGEMDQKGNCYGAFTTETIRRLRMDKCFITAACISPSFGMSIQRSSHLDFLHAVMDSSRTVIGLFPTEKIGFESTVSICPASRLDYLITDWDAPEDALQQFEEMGVKTVVVEQKEAEAGTAEVCKGDNLP